MNNTFKEDMMECMCLNCGISHYISARELSTDIDPYLTYPVVTNIYCTECGGMMFVVGKAGEQPRYLV